MTQTKKKEVMKRSKLKIKYKTKVKKKSTECVYLQRCQCLENKENIIQQFFPGQCSGKNNIRHFRCSYYTLSMNNSWPLNMI